MARQEQQNKKRRSCRFCDNDETYIDYKDERRLSRFISEQGKIIPKRIIETDEQIKALGIYSATVKLHPEVETKVKVWVVRE